MKLFKVELFMSETERQKLSEKLSKETGEKCVLLPIGVEPCETHFLFECDRKACERCHPETCHLTSDPRHAVNFRTNDAGCFYEVRNGIV